MIFVALLLCVLFAPVQAHAQGRPSYFDEPATIRLVGTAPPGELLPVLIALPPTGAPAEWFYDNIAPMVPFGAYIVILPAGAPLRSEYGPDFGRFTRGFDQRVQTDLARARSEFPVDPARIYVAGFSLGGDLAWAFLGLHPDVFRGALVLGSRCSSEVSRSALATLHARDARVVFGIGLQDMPARVSGLLAASRRVQSVGIPMGVFRFEGGHQLPVDPSLIELALRRLTE